MKEILRVARVVFQKELKESWRDSRARSAILLMPIVGAMMLGVVIGQISRMVQPPPNPSLLVMNESNAPELISFLKQHDVNVVPGSQADLDRIRNGEADLLLDIDPDCQTAFSKVKPCTVRLYSDSSQSAALSAEKRVKGLLGAFSQEIGVLRLLLRGVDPVIAGPLTVDEHDLSNSKKSSARFLALIPLLLLVGVFVSGVHVSVDMTAGERERQSMEPLLANPVSATGILLGKWLTALAFTWGGIALTIMAYQFPLHLLAFQTAGINLHFTPASWLGFGLILVPLAFFSTALQLWIGSASKSFREAQMVAQLLSLLPVAPGLYLNFATTRFSDLHYAIPVVGQSLGANVILRGEMPTAVQFFLMALGALVPAALVMTAVVRLFSRETIFTAR